MDSHEERIRQQWIAEFEAFSKLSIEERCQRIGRKRYHPILNAALFRAFNTTAEYREWCEKNLPPWLGYGPAKK
jgi:hypothetical protein